MFSTTDGTTLDSPSSSTAHRLRARPRLVLRLVALVVGASLAPGCMGDPNDPRTWAKKLDNLRDRKEALDQIARMDAERARVVVPDLIKLYEETRSPELLQGLVRYKDPRTKPLFIAALTYTDQGGYEEARIAAGALGEMKATDAVDPLIAAAEKPMPIKSPANSTRLTALRALIKIGDPRAVPTLAKILTTSADEQDFLLNQTAALGLAKFADPQSIPALLKGLFMTGRGINTFQESRLALVRIGEPSVRPLVELLEDKNPEIKEMAQRLKFDEYSPGVIPYKAAYVLGDLRSTKAVGPLLRRLAAPPKGTEHAAIVIALGQIGSPDAVDALVRVAQNPKEAPPLRASAADALYLSGDKRAVPTLMEIARSGYVTMDGTKASDLRAHAAIDLSRIAGPEHYDAFKALVEKETEAEGPFGEALDRMQVAKECGKDLACYGKALADPSWTRAEKAAFTIGFSGDAKAGTPLLLAALRPVASLPQERWPVHQAVLYSLTRLGTKSCAACIDKLQKQIDRDESAVRIPGALKLLWDTRVALAQIQSADEPRTVAAAAAPAADEAPAPKAAGKKAKGAGKASKKGDKKGGKKR